MTIMTTCEVTSLKNCRKAPFFNGKLSCGVLKRRKVVKTNSATQSYIRGIGSIYLCSANKIDAVLIKSPVCQPVKPSCFQISPSLRHHTPQVFNITKPRKKLKPVFSELEQPPSNGIHVHPAVPGPGRVGQVGGDVDAALQHVAALNKLLQPAEEPVAWIPAQNEVEKNLTFLST